MIIEIYRENQQKKEKKVSRKKTKAKKLNYTRFLQLERNEERGKCFMDTFLSFATRKKSL